MTTPALERVTYRISEVATMCGVSRGVVRRWIDQGHLRVVDLDRDSRQAVVLIPAADVDAMVAKTIVRPQGVDR